MLHFTTAAIDDVIPKKKQRGPSSRAQTQQKYQEALRHAIIDQGQALVIELDPSDKPLTIRNRVKRATEVLALKDITIRRRGSRIIAYHTQPDG